MPEGDPRYFCEIANGNAHQWQILEERASTITLYTLSHDALGAIGGSVLHIWKGWNARDY